MSYCVNCGVELDRTCQTCPLGRTPVLNPNQPVDKESPMPYPIRKGVAEPETHKEVTILISTILLTTSVICFLLNLLLVSHSHWFVYVVGPCVILWIFLIPFFFPGKLPNCACIILNGVSIAAYLNIISGMHPGQGWYQDIALPVTVLTTALVILFYLFSYRRRRSFIAKTAWLLGSAALLCVSIELLLHFHDRQPLFLSWSAVVLTCCVSVDVVLITIYFMKGLREELRRRMHF